MPEINFSARRINQLKNVLGLESYLEIGVENGFTFLDVTIPSKTAVDPRFQFDVSETQGEHCRYYEMPSDRFFQTLDLHESYDLIFIDGLHTFEQSFRDFCNSLGHAHPGTVIILDDVYPVDAYSAWPNAEEAIEFRRKSGPSERPLAWHGDVYKTLLAIHDFFPNYSYVTTENMGNPQSFIWMEQRRDFTPRFQSMEAIARLSWFELQGLTEMYNFVPEHRALASVTEALAPRRAR